MLSKKDIQLIRSLSVKKYRQKYHKYLAEGDKIVAEILSYAPNSVERLYCLQVFLNRYHELMVRNQVAYTLIDEKELKKISVLKQPNLALAVMNIEETTNPVWEGFEKQVIYLDGIQDPGNLGTMMRSVDWFGIDTLILSPDCVDPYNPKVIQAAMGSNLRIKMLQMDLEEFLEISDDKINIYFAEMSGSNAFSTNFERPLVLVLGNESKGITLRLKNHKVNSVTIPGKGRNAESLNVAVAGSILIAELCR